MPALVVVCGTSSALQLSQKYLHLMIGATAPAPLNAFSVDSPAMADQQVIVHSDLPHDADCVDHVSAAILQEDKRGQERTS